MSVPTTERVLQLARQLGTIRPRDLIASGLPHTMLAQLERQGRLERVARGIYRVADQPASSHQSLAEVCARVPKGVICLLSALQYHQLGTQSPFEVWVALPPKHWTPKSDYPPLRVVRFSGRALSEGVEEHRTTAGVIRVYSVPKTVVDCFRHRNKVGLDVALEALQACLRERRATVDELWRCAQLLRAAGVMRPYLEALA
ncbi:MAG: type IV toxin-antitoxin system AbiEi family antitoxin domain-containing protein [Armatimonadota bacterium]